VTNQQVPRIAIHRPALLRLRIRLVEDDLKDSPIGRSLCDGIRDKIAGDPDLGSPGSRSACNDETYQPVSRAQ
jgi:hypothetical protein